MRALALRSGRNGRGDNLQEERAQQAMAIAAALVEQQADPNEVVPDDAVTVPPQSGAPSVAPSVHRSNQDDEDTNQHVVATPRESPGLPHLGGFPPRGESP